MLFIYVVLHKCFTYIFKSKFCAYTHTYMHISISYNLYIYIDLIVWSCSELQGKSLIAFSKLFLKIFLNCYCLLTLKKDMCLRQYRISIVLSRDFDFQPHSSPMYNFNCSGRHLFFILKFPKRARLTTRFLLLILFTKLYT